MHNRCSATPCPIDENPHCIEFEDYNPNQCKTCEDGYFYTYTGGPCVSCDAVYCGTCSECENIDGCNICICGNREYDGSCGLRFCDDSDACAHYTTDTFTTTDMYSSSYTQTDIDVGYTTSIDGINGNYQCPSEYVTRFFLFSFFFLNFVFRRVHCQTMIN